ncbi:MAG: M48 family metalloprotease [Chloroflexi bacterium]|nr:M48 family metalloprotease [Chloroflexota bacterium]
MSALNPELEAVARELEAALGPEILAQARYQLRVRITQFFLDLILPVLWALLWLPTGWAVRLRDAFHANDSWWGTWLVLLVFLAAEALLNLPLAWYFDFRVENRLGTNRQSLGGWLWDQVKQSAVNILLQSLLFLGVYTIFRLWPERWFWGISGLVVVFLALMYLLQPLLLRLQYKAEPLDDPELDARLKALFAKVGVPYAGVAVIKAGEKTSRGNAALIPKGAGTQVVLFDTLIEAVDAEGVEVVVAHELGHKVHRDMAKLMALLGVALILALAVAYGVLRSVGTWDGLQGPGDVATYPVLALILAWLSAGLQVLLNIYSRRIERAADQFALDTTGRPEVFERVMLVLAKQNKALPLPPAWVEFFFYNHPSLARRVLAARQWRGRATASSAQG